MLAEAAVAAVLLFYLPIIFKGAYRKCQKEDRKQLRKDNKRR